MKKFGQVLSGCFLCLVLLAVGYQWSSWLLEDYAECMKTLSWPHVSGKLIGFTRNGVETNYSVNGTTYHQSFAGQNRNYYKGDITGFWHDFHREHPENSPAEIYYDPKHPERSLLIPGIADPLAFGVSVLVAITALLFPVLALVVVMLSWAKGKKDTTEN